VVVAAKPLKITAPEAVRAPPVAFVKKKFVVEALVAKRLVVVADVPVAVV
jgi:hypothetical protein